MNNVRIKINKHRGNNYKAEQIACRAILMGGIINDGLTTYEYDKETNTLIVYDGMVYEYYNPKILDSDLIFPFYNRVIQEF